MREQYRCSCGRKPSSRSSRSVDVISYLPDDDAGQKDSESFSSYGNPVERIVTARTETKTIDVVFGLHAKTIGIPQEQFRGFIESLTHTKRSTTIQEVADAAAFAASDRAASMTASTLNGANLVK